MRLAGNTDTRTHSSWAGPSRTNRKSERDTCWLALSLVQSRAGRRHLAVALAVFCWQSFAGSPLAHSPWAADSPSLAVSRTQSLAHSRPHTVTSTTAPLLGESIARQHKHTHTHTNGACLLEPLGRASPHLGTPKTSPKAGAAANGEPTPSERRPRQRLPPFRHRSQTSPPPSPPANGERPLSPSARSL